VQFGLQQMVKKPTPNLIQGTFDFLPESALFIILFCITDLLALAGVVEHLYLRNKYMTFQTAYSYRLGKINLLLIHDGENDRTGI
jgi:hypothetical protein